MDVLPANRLRLMIVENDRVTARDLEATLKRRGFLVISVAETAEEALEVAETQKPDLALLDIALTDREDGIELAIQLRDQFSIPSLFVTGYSEEAVFEKARAARPIAFVRKPFSDAELATCLESVAERADAEEKLSQRIPGLDAVSHSLNQAVIATDLSGNVVYLNPAAEALTGWSSTDACRTTIDEVLVLEENSGEPVAARTSDGQPPRKLKLVSKSGESRFVEEHSSAIKSNEGDALGIATILTETSAPAATPPPVPQTAMPASALESSNEEAPEIEFPPDTPPARREALRKIAQLSQSNAFKELVRHRESSPQSPTNAESSAPPELPQNTTESPKAEVTDASPTTVPLMEEVGDPLVKIDEDGKIIYANAEAANVFEDSTALVGSQFWSHFSTEDSERYAEQLNRPLIDGRRQRFDFHDSSRGRWFEVRVYRTREGVLALFQDITSTRVENAEQIRQQRLEGLGLLARGFAHDFNNYLTTLTGNISLAKEKHPDDFELQNMLEEAETASARATGLVQQLMTFARGGRPIRERTRISDLVRRILTEHRIMHPEIRYQFQSSETELLANVDPAQISRLIENLISNSASAMNDGGVLVVRCAQLKPEEVIDIRESHTPADEDHLLIEVIDTGHGMNEENLLRVFDPYFTTRRADNATGIGLTVCESIAKAHGGFIQLQSKEGKGTIATFCAPIGRRPDSQDEVPLQEIKLPPLPAKPSPEAAGENLLTGTRILILEDDAPIRRLMAATLRRAGHEVVETKDGRETIAVYQDAMEKGDRFHLLICDLTIENGVGGVETMRRLLEIDPNVLSIVSSGYSDAPAMASPASFGFRGVLPKPYAPSELRAAVHRILAAHHIIP